MNEQFVAALVLAQEETKIVFEFKVTLDDSDFILFNKYHLLHSPIGKKSLLPFRFIIPFISFIFVAIFIIIQADLNLIIIEAVSLTLLSVLWIGFSKKMIIKSMENGIKKMKKVGRLPYSREVILKFDDECIHEIAPDTENKTKYTLIEKIAVTEKAIYVYFSSVQAYILPITAFTDEKEKHKFLEFMELKCHKGD